MFKHPSHRNLKNRAIKRRVSSHHFPIGSGSIESNDYDNQKANRNALNKLKRQPNLLQQVKKNLKVKQHQDPTQPQLSMWQFLLDNLHNEDIDDIERLSEQVMACGQDAKLLRQYSALDCLFDDPK